jgi:hypothetical protein
VVYANNFPSVSQTPKAVPYGKGGGREGGREGRTDKAPARERV